MSVSDTIIEDSPAEALPSDTAPSRGRGRPPGSTNKAKKAGQTQVDQLQYVILGTALLKACSVLVAWRIQYPALLMSDKEARDIAKPLASIFARSALARIYGKYLSGSSDYVALGIAIYAYGERVWSQTQVIIAQNAGAQPKGQHNGNEPPRYDASTGGAEQSGPIVSSEFVNYTPGRAD